MQFFYTKILSPFFMQVLVSLIAYFTVPQLLSPQRFASFILAFIQSLSFTYNHPQRKTISLWKPEKQFNTSIQRSSHIYTLMHAIISCATTHQSIHAMQQYNFDFNNSFCVKHQNQYNKVLTIFTSFSAHAHVLCLNFSPHILTKILLPKY